MVKILELASNMEMFEIELVSLCWVISDNWKENIGNSSMFLGKILGNSGCSNFIIG